MKLKMKRIPPTPVNDCKFQSDVRVRPSAGHFRQLSHSAAIFLRIARDSQSVATFASCRQWVVKATYCSRLSIDRSAIRRRTEGTSKGGLVYALEPRGPAIMPAKEIGRGWAGRRPACEAPPDRTVVVKWHRGQRKRDDDTIMTARGN
jgi:hypothetical protein